MCEQRSLCRAIFELRTGIVDDGTGYLCLVVRTSDFVASEQSAHPRSLACGLLFSPEKYNKYKLATGQILIFQFVSTADQAGYTCRMYK